MTELSRHGTLLTLGMRLGSQSAEMGAPPSLMTAVDPSLRGGKLVGPSGFLTFKGFPKVQRSRRFSYQTTPAKRLWEIAQRWQRLIHVRKQLQIISTPPP